MRPVDTTARLASPVVITETSAKPTSASTRVKPLSRFTTFQFASPDPRQARGISRRRIESLRKFQCAVERTAYSIRLLQSRCVPGKKVVADERSDEGCSSQEGSERNAGSHRTTDGNEKESGHRPTEAREEEDDNDLRPPEKRTNHRQHLHVTQSHSIHAG